MGLRERITATHEEGIAVQTWQIILIVVIVLVVLAVLGLLLARRSKAGQERKREQAREHLQEAQIRGAKAEREHALAEEQAARARRERAEVEERAAVAEREARERVANAQQERTAADELRAKAEKLAPDVTQDRAGTNQGYGGSSDQGYVERTEVIRDRPGDDVPPQREVVREERVDGVPPQRDAGNDPAYRDGYGGDGATRR
jgi:FtsZ-interacting cell division protein ZipA